MIRKQQPFVVAAAVTTFSVLVSIVGVLPASAVVSAPNCGDFVEACEGKIHFDTGDDLDRLFNGAGARHGGYDTSDSVPVIMGAGKFGAYPHETLPQLQPAPRKGDVVPAPEIRVAQSSTAMDILAAEAEARALAAAVKQVRDAVNDYVDRDRTDDAIKEYGGCRMKDTCDK